MVAAQGGRVFDDDTEPEDHGTEDHDTLPRKPQWKGPLAGHSPRS